MRGISKDRDPKHAYQAFDKRKIPRKVGGKSEGGIVSGTNCAWHADGHLVFMEQHGEAGNSGTLMFGWNDSATDAVPVGTYFGMDHGATGKKTLRSRGLIAHAPAGLQGLYLVRTT